ncbi:MAG: hypothetical protein AAF678_13615, partial [Pseudomonadota bacterium]
MKNFLLAASVATLSFTAAANAASVVVDFEFGSEGDVVTGDTVDGVTLDSNERLVLFQSNCNNAASSPLPNCSGNDGDLATGPDFDTDPQGLVLIIDTTDSGDPDTDPNDSAGGGEFIFDFTENVFLETITLLDIDNNPSITSVSFDFLFGDGTSSTGNAATGFAPNLLNPAFPNDNSLTEFTFNLANVDTFTVDFNGSGAVAALAFTTPDGGTPPVPLPAGA